jgi:hypothetical protein
MVKIDLPAPVFAVPAAPHPGRGRRVRRRPVASRGGLVKAKKQQEAAMRTFPTMIGFLVAPISLALFLTADPSARANDMPDYFKQIVGAETATEAEVETKNILALNATMLDLYANAAQTFKNNILVQHPVILGLFLAQADVSSYIVRACRRSKRIRFRSPISC